MDQDSRSAARRMAIAVIGAFIVLGLAAFVTVPARSQPAKPPAVERVQPPQTQCQTVDDVRGIVRADGGEEAAHLQGDRARRFLDATQAPPGAASVLVFRHTDFPLALVVLFDERGCAITAGRFDPAVIAPLLGGI